MTLVSNAETVSAAVSTAQYDVVVVGAGPYGLAAAAYLLRRNLKVAVFGKPMSFWRESMPRGMYLRSAPWASSIGDPQKRFGLEQFAQASSQPLPNPLPIQMFIDYGLWFQKQAVPNVDETFVTSIEREGGRFQLTLEDGRHVSSLAVVMAIGLAFYDSRPEEYAALPAEMISHSMEHGNFDRFAGKRVLVVGRGQSAVESAALLNEAGASVHLISRGPIAWIPPDRERSLYEKIRRPTTGLFFGWKYWFHEHLPYQLHWLPKDRKERFVGSSLSPLASDWLRARVIGKVALHEGDLPKNVEAVKDHVELQLASGEVVKVDHVLLATGYQGDIKRISLLHPELRDAIQPDAHNTPALNPWFESSVPGLYFVGVTSLWSFGPLYRFVCGSAAAGARVSGAVARRVARARRRGTAR